MRGNNLISVIVPFHNAEDTLKILLCSLQNQVFSGQYEIVLVNNRSTDGSKSIIECFQRDYPENAIQLIDYHEQASSYGARNVGVEHATGQFYAFTDADCRPSEYWLASIASFFKSTSDAVMSGAVQLEIVDQKNPWEIFDSLAHMNNSRNTTRAHVATANMAVSASDFAKVGRFQCVFSGGDHDWSKRAKSKGLCVNFCQDALIFHPTRKKREEIEKKLFRIAKGQGQLVKQMPKSKLIPTIRFLLRTILPLRHVWYGFFVSKKTGISIALKFAGQYFAISVRQCIVFVDEYQKDG
jgi:glycosyltransferase involved in cell wall biosynthesis